MDGMVDLFGQNYCKPFYFYHSTAISPFKNSNVINKKICSLYLAPQILNLLTSHDQLLFQICR